MAYIGIDGVEVIKALQVILFRRYSYSDYCRDESIEIVFIINTRQIKGITVCV